MATHLLEDCDHPHTEGFALMIYVSEDGGESAVVWNARNGVVPFGFTHPYTGTELIHKAWADDIINRDHVPEVGDLIWVNLIESVARQNVTERVESMWNDSENPVCEAFETKEQAIDVLTTGLFLDPDCAPPTLMRVDEDAIIAIRAKAMVRARHG